MKYYYRNTLRVHVYILHDSGLVYSNYHFNTHISFDAFELVISTTTMSLRLHKSIVNFNSLEINLNANEMSVEKFKHKLLIYAHLFKTIAICIQNHKLVSTRQMKRFIGIIIIIKMWLVIMALNKCFFIS